MTNLSNRPSHVHALICAAIVIALTFPSAASVNARAPKNSWRGITPLRSTVTDVSRLLGQDPDSFNLDAGNTFKVEDGEVFFSFLSPSLAKIYHAPRSLVGKVFSIHFRPLSPPLRSDLKVGFAYKKCFEQLSKKYYYLVSDFGLAYQVRRQTDQVEVVIYQPARYELSRLRVTAECVF